MSESNSGVVARAIIAGVAGVQRFALVVVLVWLAASVGLLWYTVNHLGVNTEAANMLSKSLPWRQDYIAFQRAFPDYGDSILVVIDGSTPELAEDARQRLAARLASRDSGYFREVYQPGGGPFFSRNGLLYLSVADLQKLSDRLVRIQPLIGRIASDYSLHGLFSLLTTMLGRSDGNSDAAVDFQPIFTALAEGFDASRQGRFHRLSWQQLMDTQTRSDAGRRLLVLRSSLNYRDLEPGVSALARVRAQARALHLNAAHGVRVRLTGSVALSAEELASISSGAALAGVLSLIMVAIVLYLGLRSARLMAASLLTLIAGLIGTAAFAAFAVGSLNLVSIAFAILYIGLGIDYAIHLCLRYAELRNHRQRLLRRHPHALAMRLAAGDVGAALVLCAITTAAGFYAFIPTEFNGIADMGLISGTGMFVSLFASLTLLPALLTLFPLRADPQPAAEERVVTALPRWGGAHRGWVRAGALLAALASVAALPFVHFDANSLHLKNQSAESVRTYKDLLHDSRTSPLSAQSLAPNLHKAAALAKRLTQLPAVDHAVSLDSFVPKNQDKKLAIISDLGLTMGFGLVPSKPLQVHADSDLAALASLRTALKGYQAAAAKSAAALGHAIDQWCTHYTAESVVMQQEALKRLAQTLLAGLKPQLKALDTSLQAQRVSLADLPEDLKHHWVGPHDNYRVEAFPVHDLNNDAARRVFAAQVQSVDSHATGTPILELRAGRAVVNAFRHALVYAAIFIVVLLLVLLRSPVDALRVLIPLVLAGLLLLAASVVFKLPFNFANVITLPLLLGVGVDNGIHMVQRAHHRGETPLIGSTPRAVLFSGLTTLFSFGNLAFSGDAGINSMGRMLAIGMALTLICTLVVLPALLPVPKTAETKP